MTKFIQYSLMLTAFNLFASDQFVKDVQKNQRFHIWTDRSNKDIDSIELSGRMIIPGADIVEFSETVKLDYKRILPDQTLYFRDIKGSMHRQLSAILLQKVIARRADSSILVSTDVDKEFDMNERKVNEFSGEIVGFSSGVSIYFKREDSDAALNVTIEKSFTSKATTC